MNIIIGDARISCYIIAISALLVLILMLFSRIYRRDKRTLDRDFRRLCILILTGCVLSFLYNAMYAQSAPWCRTVTIIGKTLRDVVLVLMVLQWSAYVWHKLYGGRQSGRSLLLIPAFLPLGVVFVLLIVNLFTGILFTVSAENRVEARPLLHLIYAVIFAYLIGSAFVIHHHTRNSSKIHFLHTAPIIVPVLLASSVQLFSPYDIGALGQAIGIFFLYFSIIGELRFVDEESGLYNRGYLIYLYDLALTGKADAQSAVILEADGNIPACLKILRATLHRSGDVIRVEEKKFLMFSGERSRSTLQYQTSLAEEAAEKFNSEHPEEKVHLTARCLFRSEGEDTFSFLHSVMDAREEAGDEMRGIVSMISELDRLDQELELASDIQYSALPMNFPAFPERKEFDLYASMTPAKEVGGDFYDFFLIDSDHLALVIADVSGKGIPAALFMMVSKTLIKKELMEGCDPATTMTNVNQQLCERNSADMFVTVWLAVVELSTGKGLACNAGHEKPGLRRAGGDFELLKYRHGAFAGVSKKAKYDNREFQLQSGDCIFVYTDGVPEANNSGKEMFKDARLLETLNSGPDAPPEELIDRMHSAVDAFAAGAEQFDDITMLCFKYYGG